ncbi:MAG: hypothetical protein KGI72_05635 [Patescibacteria group bacterium]|nr:hypothetical protein [Patescibacteria group bacterium]
MAFKKYLLIAVTLVGLNGKILWIAPTTNMDGSPLTDLAGFKLYCGAASRVYSIKTNIPGASSTTLPVTKAGLKDGVWYCALTAYNTSGGESGYSNELNFNLDLTPPSGPTQFK